MKEIIIILILTGLFYTNNIKACTAFCLKNKNNIILAKNLDWSVDLGYVFINKAGIKKTSFNAAKFNWVSKYGSITFNQFGKEFPLGGMNEKGLVIEELNMAYVQLIPDSNKSKINEFQLAQFILDNCKSMDEVITQLDNIQLNIILQTLHYIVCDSSGNTLIIEFNGNSFDYYPNKSGLSILSNNNYLESIKYLKNFTGFGGKLPVLNRQGSNERFVSVANMLSNYRNEEPINYTFNILDTVKQEDTRWSIVYDITNLKIYVKFHNCSKKKIVDLKKINFRDAISAFGFDIKDCSNYNESSFHIITKDQNRKLIQQVFFILSKEIELTNKKELFDRMATYGNQNISE